MILNIGMLNFLKVDLHLKDIIIKEGVLMMKASSMKVMPGFKATVYEHDNLEGEKRIFGDYDFYLLK